MKQRSADNLRGPIRTRQERILIERVRLSIWLTIAMVLALWGLGASHLLENAGSPVPLLNILELCILTAAVTQVQRPWWRQHVIGLTAVLVVQIIAVLAPYARWTGNLWIFSLRMTVLN